MKPHGVEDPSPLVSALERGVVADREGGVAGVVRLRGLGLVVRVVRVGPTGTCGRPGMSGGAGTGGGADGAQTRPLR